MFGFAMWSGDGDGTIAGVVGSDDVEMNWEGATGSSGRISQFSQSRPLKLN